MSFHAKRLFYIEHTDTKNICFRHCAIELISYSIVTKIIFNVHSFLMILRLILKSCLFDCPSDLKPISYRHYIDHIFMLFQSKTSAVSWNTWTRSTKIKKIGVDKENNKRLFLLNIQIFCQLDQLNTSVYL